MVKNNVIAGDYSGKLICNNAAGVYIPLNFTGSKKVMLNKDEIESYELITEDITKSAVSGVVRGAVGVSLVGPVGLLAGISAKNKGIYTIAVKFKDGKNSLIELDEKAYKVFIRANF